MSVGPKEKEGQGTFHLGRSGAWNESRKVVLGVNAALFLAVYRIPRGQNSAMANGAAPSTRLPGPEACLPSVPDLTPLWAGTDAYFTGLC